MTGKSKKSTPQAHSSTMDPATSDVLVTLLQQMEENRRLDREDREREREAMRQEREALQQMMQDMSTSSSGSSHSTSHSKTLNPARPEKLDVDTNYSKFIAWRESWNDYGKNWVSLILQNIVCDVENHPVDVI